MNRLSFRPDGKYRRGGAQARSAFVVAGVSALLCARPGDGQLLPGDTLATDTVRTDTMRTASVLATDFAGVDTAPRDSSATHRSPVSPLLPLDHWSVRAATRARDLGLAPGFFPAQRSVHRAAVAAALADAVERASAAGGRHGELTTRWLRRFQEEFPEYEEGGGRGGLLGGAARVRVVDERGLLEPAFSMWDARRAPLPRVGAQEWAAGVTAAVRVGPLALMVEPMAGQDGVRVPRWNAEAFAGPFSFGFGREGVGYGPARSGGIVLSGTVPLVRAQVQMHPVRLPSLLRHLGPTTLHTSLTRLEEPRHPGKPWFWSARMGFQPHARVEAGITRAAVFGGDSISTPVTAGNVARMFLGVLSHDFENQVVSLDLRWRLPSERVLPATAYMEWGAEDASGAWWTVPGRTFGVLFPDIPGAPSLQGGMEYTRFGTLCCGNPPWYVHLSLPGGWVYRGDPLGHPLGGEGGQATVYADADLMDARLRVSTRGFLRNRGDAGLRLPQRGGNLYAPLRGRSVGGSVDATLRVGPRVEGRAFLYHDGGDGWSERRLQFDLSYLF